MQISLSRVLIGCVDECYRIDRIDYCPGGVTTRTHLDVKEEWVNKGELIGCDRQTRT